MLRQLQYAIEFFEDKGKLWVTSRSQNFQSSEILEGEKSNCQIKASHGKKKTSRKMLLATAITWYNGQNSNHQISSLSDLTKEHVFHQLDVQEATAVLFLGFCVDILFFNYSYLYFIRITCKAIKIHGYRNPLLKHMGSAEPMLMQPLSQVCQW